MRVFNLSADMFVSFILRLRFRCKLRGLSLFFLHISRTGISIKRMFWNTNYMKNIKIQPLSHGKHLIPLFHTNQLILFKQIITVCFQNRNENKYTMWEKCRTCYC